MSRTCAMLLASLVCMCACADPTPAELTAGFVHPPNSAKPHTWWHWMHGNATKTGITRDLEEMARVGVGGAQMFEVSHGIPKGPVDYNTPEWRALVKHAVMEADRVGMELCIHNCAGWSSSGGPWVTPEHAMKMLVFTDAIVQGPGQVQVRMKQPETRRGFYRDIALLAYPTPPAEAAMANVRPVISADQEGFQGDRLVDGNPGSAATLNLRAGGDQKGITFEYPEPFTARSLTVWAAPGRAGLTVELQVADEDGAFRPVTRLGIGEPGLLRAPACVGFAPVTGRLFRIVFPGASRSVSLGDIALGAGYRISNWAGKAGFDVSHNPAFDTVELGPEAIIASEDIQNISASMDAEGNVTWNAPEGNWTLLRMGYTLTGKENHPASDSGRGLECDKMSKEAAEAHFEGMLGKLIEEIGPLAGKVLNNILIDSYEVDCQNWTQKMPEEFKARRGYELLPFLPALTGRVVDSLEQSERFLWDYRQTIGDLFADCYFGHYAELAHRHGMMLSVEPYGNAGFNELISGGRGDIPMTEFWVGWGVDHSGGKMASSIAHTNALKFVGAESFTASPENGRWQNHPYSLKQMGDFIYCGGVNRFIFHRYAQQPWETVRPGMTMGPWGFHFERTNTWWNDSPAWLTYLARCQYLLQEGLFFADLCYYQGEGAPAGLPGRNGLRPVPPAGYDYDGCSSEVLLNRMSVKDGRIVLPDGMNYRMLILPERDTMSLPILEKIASLVRDGATVMGRPPAGAPGLSGYPHADAQVRALAAELWGPCDGQTVTENRVGKGRIIWGRSLEDVLAEMDLAPDFQYTPLRGEVRVPYIHRVIAGHDIYFISSQSRRVEAVDCSFRITGRPPQLWDAVTGSIKPAPLWREENGRTVVSLRFGPADSVFVVFPPEAASRTHAVSATLDGRPLVSWRTANLPDLEIRNAVYGVLSVPQQDMVDVTQQVAALVRDGTLTVAATNALAGDPAPNVVKQMRVQYVYNGTPATITVEENETVRLPRPGDVVEGQEGRLEIKRALYGILPPEGAPEPKPATIDVTEILAGMVKDNTLSVVAGNQLAGDPAHLIVKQLRVDYSLDGKPYSRTYSENQTISLPEGTEPEATRLDVTPAELAVSPDGDVTLTAWQGGNYEIVLDSGQAVQRSVTDIPEPLEVIGPWQVRFPPNLGAPESATFDKLISWPESDVPGIKYFSGTATYARTVNVPADFLAANRRVKLELGQVREIARVSVNGTPLGIFWKPPFDVDVTDVLKPGDNMLEISVTNLWPNRLIGDEQFPEDAEWSGGGPLKAIPEWLAQGKPRPETGRIAFATYKHWHKDSPLLESGLIGPVTLQPGVVLRVSGTP